MRALSAAELLNVWELGLAQSPTARALTLLAAACPEASSESLARLTVGERDARLLTLRKWTFGSQLVCVANCKACGEQLELSFDAGDLFMETDAVSNEDSSLTVGEYELRFRLPNSLDLIALANCQDLNEARRRLLERCISKIERHGQSIASADVSAAALEALATRMGEIDSSGNVQLLLNCPQCAHSAAAIFDIESFFWKEINAWATRILREVHQLAFAYGWREVDVLNMSAWRRQVYLNLIGA